MTDIDPDFKAKLKTIQFGKPRSSQSLMESRWDRDMPAYHRLRMNGLQPKQIDGCAELESRANSQLEVELGDTLRDLAVETGEPIKKLMPRVEEGMALSKELDWKPQDSVEAVKDKYHR